MIWTPAFPCPRGTVSGKCYAFKRIVTETNDAECKLQQEKMQILTGFSEVIAAIGEGFLYPCASSQFSHIRNYEETRKTGIHPSRFSCILTFLMCIQLFVRTPGTVSAYQRDDGLRCGGPSIQLFVCDQNGMADFGEGNH